MNAQALATALSSTAELLRGDYKQSDYGKVILPFMALQRLDCVLRPTKGGAAEFVAHESAFDPVPRLDALEKLWKSWS
nr:type I restriction-modification system subunit M N-terminal domain-containing protein [uncultured Caldimonas sp.]